MNLLFKHISGLYVSKDNTFLFIKQKSSKKETGSKKEINLSISEAFYNCINPVILIN